MSQLINKIKTKHCNSASDREVIQQLLILFVYATTINDYYSQNIKQLRSISWQKQ